MIDLRKYFLDNVGEDDYYWRFRVLVEGVNTRWNVFSGKVEVPDNERCDFEVFDEEEVIEKFRTFCLPEHEIENTTDKCWFYVVSYFLRCQGYAIKEFPRVLDRPPSDPTDFAYGEIRQKAIECHLNDGYKVSYDARRKIIHDMTFVKKSSTIMVGDELGRRIQMISSRGAAFDEMAVDEKLEMLADLIESLLKVDGRFVSVDCKAVMLDFVDEGDIKGYRKTLQCYRHTSDGAIAERADFTDDQKEFLIDYGVTVCKALAKMVRR